MKPDPVMSALDWQAGATCASADPRLFDVDTADLVVARAYCRRCPVVAECLAARAATGAVGVYGGRLFGGRGQPTPHGTRSCYSNHGCRRAECVAAAREYERDVKRRRKAA